MERDREQGLQKASLITTESADEIPVVHRLAIIYLMLPVVIWLVGWFEWWFGVPAAVLITLGLWQALRPARASHKWQVFSGALRSALRPTTVVLLLIALAWVMTTAAGGVFDVQNPDWHKHRSILLDLGRGDWPTEPVTNLRDHLNVPILLRHYLGYHMVPGLIGRWLGPAALNWAVPLWTWCGVSLILLMFTRGCRGWKVIVAAMVLIFFSGMDIVRIALLEGWDWFEFGFGVDGWPRIDLGRSHLEWDRSSDIKIQFSSHIVGLMWVPKHFVAAGLYVLLFMQLRRHGPFLAISGVLLAASLFWSPFVAIGLLPFALVSLIERGIRPFLRWQNLLMSLPLAALLFVYLSSGTGSVEHGWIWEIHLNSLQEAVFLPILYLCEFLVVAFLLLVLRPRLRLNLFFITCLATLLLLPLYSFGSNNELVMRGAMPALFLLCYFCKDAITGPTFFSSRRQMIRNLTLCSLLIVVLVIGAVTPLFELVRANNEHDFGLVRYEELGISYSIMGIFEDLPPKIYVPLYVTNEAPNWFYRVLGFDVIDQAPVKGKLVFKSEYDVYINGRTLVFIKDQCSHDEEGLHFFVHVVPLDSDSLPKSQVHFNMDFSFTPRHALKIGKSCYAVRELPNSYGIGHVTTGQFNLERTGHSWLRHYFSDAYRDRLLAEAGEPIIRSDYDIYLHQEKAGESADQPNRLRLLYFKPACSQDEIGTRFFMHVIPRSAEDLPDDRKEAGYEELNFALEDYGGRYGGDCFAVRDLPEYDILEIRTGQTTGENSNSWQGSFTLGN